MAPGTAPTLDLDSAVQLATYEETVPVPPAAVPGTIYLRRDGEGFMDPALAPAAQRYKGAGLLGSGGMSKVHRVRDLRLNRNVAMKVVLDDYKDDKAMRSRFLEEAQITAQLAHPAIVPVHDLGQLADGRFYLTMKEVRGRTLAQAIHDAQVQTGGWTESTDAPPFRKLIDAVRRVSVAIGYAHTRGVIHRDLKPANIMVGEFDEVMVMDWGLARQVEHVGQGPVDPLVVEKLRGTTTTTGYGTLAGTPQYMPPEQARGAIGELGPGSDVYSLGVILYEVLVGRPPFDGGVIQVLSKITTGEPIAFPEGLLIPEELQEIALTAMSFDPEERYPDGRAFAEAIEEWLEGSRRRERASRVLAEAQSREADIDRLHGEAVGQRALAQRALRELPADASLEELEEPWELLDHAADLQREAETRVVEVLQLAQNALVHDPDLLAARALLARMHHRLHREAEARRDVDMAARHELGLQANDVGEFAEYLAGEGTVELDTTVPAEVVVRRFEVRHRRLVAGEPQALGKTPLRTRLPSGSYLAELRAPGRRVVRYPIAVERVTGWRSLGPDGEAAAVDLPDAGELGPDDVYVPAGRFVAGGDPLAPGAGPRQAVWLPGFVMRRHPVTWEEFAEFLASAAGRPHRAGLRSLGEMWAARWPVTHVRWSSALAFARWEGERSGLPWRLPFELEWEKAARGVDGRRFPWGDYVAPAFCRMHSDGSYGGGSPAAVDEHELDVSPYDVWGLGGNAREWCMDAPSAEGVAARGGVAQLAAGEAERRVVRGGSYRSPGRRVCSAGRSALIADRGFVDVGFRLARPWPG